MPPRSRSFARADGGSSSERVKRGRRPPERRESDPSRSEPRVAKSPPAPSVAAASWGILLLALGLRLWHLREGLPDFFEEAFPFRRAFEMAGWESGRADANPHAFHYPSLSFYLHMAVQQALYLAGHVLAINGTPPG